MKTIVESISLKKSGFQNKIANFINDNRDEVINRVVNRSFSGYQHDFQIEGHCITIVSIYSTFEIFFCIYVLQNGYQLTLPSYNKAVRELVRTELRRHMMEMYEEKYGS